MQGEGNTPAVVGSAERAARDPQHTAGLVGGLAAGPWQEFCTFPQYVGAEMLRYETTGTGNSDKSTRVILFTMLFGVINGDIAFIM